MSGATYLRYEVLRTLRNRRFLLFSLGFPLVLFVMVAGANRSRTLDGIGFPLYYMSGMVAWGSIIAIISSGSRIAAERQVGWTRQLRITPLRTRAYFGSKIVCGYMMALLTIVVLYGAGAALSVRLGAAQWATMTFLLLVGLVPFAILGIMLGHLVKPDSLGPAVGGITALFALLGGAWGPLSTSGTFLDVVKCIPPTGSSRRARWRSVGRAGRPQSPGSCSRRGASCSCGSPCSRTVATPPASPDGAG